MHITTRGTALLFLSVLFALICCSRCDLIADTCKKTDYPELCISTLRSDPLSETADVKGLARIVLKVLLVKVNATLNRANDLAKESEDRFVKAYLDVCASQYDDAIYEEIPEAIENLQPMKLLLVLLLVRRHLMRSRKCVNRP